MSSQFRQITAAIVAMLSAGPAVSSYIEADVDEDEPIPSAQADAVRVVLRGSVPQQFGGIHGNPVDWTTRVDVFVYAAVAGGTACDAADALVLEVFARLSATPGLGMPAEAGVYVDPPQIDWAQERADRREARARMSLTIGHRTSAGSLA